MRKGQGKKLRKTLHLKTLFLLVSILYVQMCMGMTVFASASEAQTLVDTELLGFSNLVVAIVSGIGQLITAWAIFEFGMAQQTNDGMQTSQSLKRGAGGLLMMAASSILEIISEEGEEMPDWLIDFLLGGPTYVMGNAIWSGAFSMMSGLLGTTPMDFSSSAWTLASKLYSWSLGAALGFLNILALIGFTREASNLREQLTIEMFVMMCLRVVATNIIFIKGLDVMKSMFTLAAKLSNSIVSISTPTFGVEDFDGGTFFFFCIFGLLYLLVSIVCALLILLAIYGRYLKLYAIVALAPLAMSTIAGGRGINNTAYTFIRSFIATTFEIIVIAVILTIATVMMSSIDFGTIDTALGSTIDGFGAVLQSIMTMVLLTVAVKGSESFIKKYFGL